MQSLEQLQQNFIAFLLGEDRTIEQCIQSTEECDASTRMSVYGNAYRLRLQEALATDFPVLHGYLGDEQFEFLAQTYIKRYPSQTYSLRYFSQNLPQLLLDEAPFQQHKELNELASVEQAFANSFDAPNAETVKLEQLAQLQPDAWPELSLTFSHSLTCLSLNTNCMHIWRALSAEEGPPSVIHHKQPEYWIIWRKPDLVSHYKYLERAEATAFQLALQGQSFANLCECLLDFYEEAETPLKAVGLLQAWIQEGLIVELVT